MFKSKTCYLLLINPFHTLNLFPHWSIWQEKKLWEYNLKCEHIRRLTAFNCDHNKLYKLYKTLRTQVFISFVHFLKGFYEHIRILFASILTAFPSLFFLFYHSHISLNEGVVLGFCFSPSSCCPEQSIEQIAHTTNMLTPSPSQSPHLRP